MVKNLLSILAAVMAMMAAAPAGAGDAQKLTVSAAVSLKEAFTEIAAAYEREIGHKVLLNFAASGHLLAQIRQGAPVDVFVSAADLQMNQAEEQKLIDPATRRVIATNTLILIVPAGAASPLRGFGDLKSPNLKRVAVGEPRNVPAGAYAMEVLDHLGLRESLKSRLVAGAGVRQVLDYVERGEVDAGIVYSTDARQSGEKVRIAATADPAWHDPIRYAAAVVAASRHPAAGSFIEYLTTEPAQAILRGKGFKAPEPATSAPAGR